MKVKSALIVFAAVLLMSVNAFAFTDVNENDWYYENVTKMAEQGYLNGYEDGSFRPNGTVTKAELVSMVMRAAVIPEGEKKNSHWADGMIQGGLSAGLFDWDEIPPAAQNYDEPITRQLAVKITMKGILKDFRGDYNKAANEINDFSELDGRYYDTVIAAYCMGVVQGDDNGKLNPKSYITRAEACAVIMRALNISGGNTAVTPNVTEKPLPSAVRKGGVSENGMLHVIGTQLVNEKNEPVILNGMSSHGLQWYGKFVSEGAIKATADYGANVFRCAMYTEEGGYISNPNVKNTLIKAVDAAINEDMYVIIDWHILSDGNPMQHEENAAEFFAEMSERYKDNPAVIYEICNEPNGNITWDENVKPYAERIIPVIRANTNAVILVGSPTWSQDLQEAAKNPIDAENIMYTCHFYAGTHTEWLRQRIADCGLPVFVSEWGTSAADGSGGVYLEESRKWIDFMNEHGISRVNWSLCDKNESSAALVSGADVDDGISMDELSESGRFVFEQFK